MRFRPKVSPEDAMRYYREATGDDETPQSDEIVKILRAVLYAFNDNTATELLSKASWFETPVARELAAMIMRRKYEKDVRSKRLT